MSSRLSHWTLLAMLATLNLILWVALAVVLGLVVSDKVDLGVETLIRQRQPTVVAAWRDAFAKASMAAVTPTAASTESTIHQSPQASAVPRQSAPVMSAGEGLPAPAEKKAKPTLTMSPPISTIPDGGAKPVHATSTPTPPLSKADQPTIQPEPTLVSSPLLMADPQFSNLMQLNQEMAQSEPGRAVQIRYSEAALNQEIQNLLQNNPKLPYRDVYLDLSRHQAVVTGDVTVLGLQVGTEVVGTVEAEDCLPHMEIESISIEGIFTPRFVKDKIKALLLQAWEWYPHDYPLCIEQVVLEEDGATVYGYRR